MVFKFLNKLKRNMSESKIEPENKENFLEEKRDLEEIIFVLNDDEKIVVDFLSNMDKNFGSSNEDRRKQGDHFERFLAAVFRLAGYEVEITKKSYVKNNRVYTGDGGVDLILKSNKMRIAVQAKSNRLDASPTPNLIGRKDVTDFTGISNANWDRKMFITTSFFNHLVYEEIKQNEKAREIEWYDRYHLLKLLNDLIPDTMLKQQLLSSLPKDIKVCPKCTVGFLVRRKNTKTDVIFRGCSKYCGYTESIKNFA